MTLSPDGRTPRENLADATKQHAQHGGMVKLLRTDITAVVLDVGGVLLVPHPEPVTAALASIGIQIDSGNYSPTHVGRWPPLEARGRQWYRQGE